MATNGREGRQIAASLAHRAGSNATAAQIAAFAIGIWEELDAALSPIIGKRGVAALFTRSLHLTRDAHAFFAAASNGHPTEMGLAALRAVLGDQHSTEAAVAAAALLRTFHELLTSLVGASLTERLLRSIWATFLTSPPQDNSR
jgi:hypothetical protein